MRYNYNFPNFYVLQLTHSFINGYDNKNIFYSQAFLSEDYIQAHPNDEEKVKELKDLLLEQVRTFHFATNLID